VVEKKSDLVELTEKEFLKVLFDTTDSLQNNIYDIQKQQKEFFKLYREFCHDKNEYRLRFFVENNRLFYKVFDKCVGFKYRGKQK
jgi:hypothetical protein